MSRARFAYSHLLLLACLFVLAASACRDTIPVSRIEAAASGDPEACPLKVEFLEGKRAPATAGLLSASTDPIVLRPTDDGRIWTVCSWRSVGADLAKDVDKLLLTMLSADTFCVVGPLTQWTQLPKCAA